MLIDTAQCSPLLQIRESVLSSSGIEENLGDENKQSDQIRNSSAKVSVVVRIRRDTRYAKSDDEYMSLENENKTIIINNLKSTNGSINSADRTFTFDSILDSNVSQSEVFQLTAIPILEKVTGGFNGTILAYGQTGTGKTYTIEGPVSYESVMIPDLSSSDSSFQQIDPLTGLVPRIVNYLFQWRTEIVNKLNISETDCEIFISVVEIYCERVRDLLSQDPKIAHDGPGGVLKIRDSVSSTKRCIPTVDGLTEKKCFSLKDALTVLSMGQSTRTVGSTNMNSMSSRSHLLMRFRIVHRNSESEIESKLTVVDLAGSERVCKTQSDGVVFQEGKNINQSLSCLGNVINALSSAPQFEKSKMVPSPHFVPFRDSKLTRYLQDCLGGNSMLCLVCTISDSSENESETLSTLRFGQRSKMIKLTVLKNESKSRTVLESELAQANMSLETVMAYSLALESSLKQMTVTSPRLSNSIEKLFRHRPSVLSQFDHLHRDSYSITQRNIPEEENCVSPTLPKTKTINRRMVAEEFSNIRNKHSDRSPMSSDHFETPPDRFDYYEDSYYPRADPFSISYPNSSSVQKSFWDSNKLSLMHSPSVTLSRDKMESVINERIGCMAAKIAKLQTLNFCLTQNSESQNRVVHRLQNDLAESREHCEFLLRKYEDHLLQ